MNLCGRFKIALANRSVSRSGAGGFSVGVAATALPHTAQWLWPAPTMDWQLGHIVGRVELLFEAFDNKFYNENKRDAFE